MARGFEHCESQASAGLQILCRVAPAPMGPTEAGLRSVSLQGQRHLVLIVTPCGDISESFPDAPKDQNALGHYLLFRDIAAISLVLGPIAAALLVLLRATNRIIALALCLFGVQYLLAAVAARNQSIRLVTRVIALHSVKRL
jgi:hypothetical protein